MSGKLSPVSKFSLSSYDASGVVEHDHGVTDSKGRKVGYNTWIRTRKVLPWGGYGFYTPDHVGGFTPETEVVYEVGGSSTRDGKPFGALRNTYRFASRVAAEKQAAKMAVSARRRALKKFAT